MNTTEKTYEKYVYAYGVGSVLFVLEFFEKTEKYEECQKIINAIHSIEDVFKDKEYKLPTRIDKEGIQFVMEGFKLLKMYPTEEEIVDRAIKYGSIILEELLGEVKC